MNGALYPKQIHFLEKEKWSIIKEINIVKKSLSESKVTIGRILYKRNITKNYKLNYSPGSGDIRRVISYQHRDLFSVDQIDSLLLAAVRNRFPRSFIHNYHAIFDGDQVLCDYLTKVPIEKGAFMIRPDFKEIDLYNCDIQSFPQFFKEVKIYQGEARENMPHLLFEANSDYRYAQEVIDELYEVEFL